MYDDTVRLTHMIYVEVYREHGIREARSMPINQLRDTHLPKWITDPDVRCVVGDGHIHFTRDDLKKLPLIEVLTGEPYNG